MHNISCYLACNLKTILYTIQHLYVTGFAIIIPNGTRIEIQFFAEYQTHSYRWQSLLSQMTYYLPCQTITVHYRVCEASEWH